MLASILFITLGKIAFYWPLRHRTQEQIVKSAMLDSHFMESIRNISALQRFNAESRSESEYINRLVDVTNASVRVGHVEISYDLFSTGFRSIIYIVVVYLLARSVLSEEFTLGMLYAFLAYFDRTISAVEAFTSEVLKGLMLRLHLDRLSDITSAEGTAVHDRQLKLESNPASALTVRNGGFSYKDAPVFSNLSLSLPPGEHLAIFGPSGSGKTTFIKAAQGLLPLDAGEIVLNDHLLSNENQKMLADRVGSVMQEDQLLSGTILENITFRDPHPNFEKAADCCKQVLLHDEIMAHPLSYDRKVYEMDPSLSSGQRQKLLLARALYREPTLLFLDEGTAHLDRKTAVAVMRNILATRITCVYSTHMIECISFASQVLETGNRWTVRKNDQRAAN